MSSRLNKGWAHVFHFSFGKNMGSCLTWWGWNDSWFHQVLTMLDGWLVQALFARHCSPPNQAYFCYWTIIAWVHDILWQELNITTQYYPRRWQYGIVLISSIHYFHSFNFVFFLFFLFACLQYIVAMSYLRQSALGLHPSVCDLHSQRSMHAIMEVWPSART